MHVGKFWHGKRLVNLANHELYAKIFFANIQRYGKNLIGICTDFLKLASSPNFFSLIAFTCMDHQKFPVYSTLHLRTMCKHAFYT